MAKSPLGRYQGEEIPTPKNPILRLKTEGRGNPGILGFQGGIWQQPWIHPGCSQPQKSIGFPISHPRIWEISASIRLLVDQGIGSTSPVLLFQGFFGVFPFPKSLSRPGSGSFPARGFGMKSQKNQRYMGNPRAQCRHSPMCFPCAFP